MQKDKNTIQSLIHFEELCSSETIVQTSIFLLGFNIKRLTATGKDNVGKTRTLEEYKLFVQEQVAVIEEDVINKLIKLGWTPP